MATLFIARHGETVFNASARMQGSTVHTPLTRAGFAQAEKMGEALRRRLGPRPSLDLWSSTAGRALQTLAVIAEHLELDWHRARTDTRLGEIDIGEWSGRYYADVVADQGPIVDRATGLFSCRPPGGESYAEVGARLQDWLDEHRPSDRPRLVVMHGMSARVLRGLLVGTGYRSPCGAPVAPGLRQGAVVEVVDGVEQVLGGTMSEGEESAQGAA
ncbi:MAG: histidine phosphatase family protein [Allosphingosinicella sp.]